MNLEDLEFRLNDVHKDALEHLCPLLEIPIFQPIPVFIDPIVRVSCFGKIAQDPKTRQIISSTNYGIGITLSPWYKEGIDRTSEEITRQCMSDTVHETGHYIHVKTNEQEYHRGGSEVCLELVADFLTLFYHDEKCNLFDWSTENSTLLLTYQKIKTRERKINIARQLIKGTCKQMLDIPEVWEYIQNEERKKI